MTTNLRSVRGMNDILPADTPRWQHLERSLHDVLRSYGYDEIRLPIVEQSGVFDRAIGEATDIVQKEMYTFADRNGDKLTLRPEGTASCVRAVLQGGLLQQLPLKLWYQGAMFRHERPQRGRQRQFHQIGAEVFGVEGPDIDAELILMTARMWAALDIGPVRLEINSLGTASTRASYREVLTDYFQQHRDELDADSVSRLERNPLRILDSKNPDMAALIEAAPTLTDHLDDASRAHFDVLQERLEDNNVEFVVNPRLVRGLDYYSLTVFEWITTDLGAQGTICAGGRYDGLVELMGGRATPAIGFAMGLERLLELHAQSGALHDVDAEPAVYVLGTGVAEDAAAMNLAERLRAECPRWRVKLHIGGGSMKSRMKKADRSGADYALILGEDEIAANAVTVKPLRADAQQQRIAQTAIATELAPDAAGGAQ